MELPIRYEIKSELGSGAMGAVYKAYDTKLKRYVAVKVLHKMVGLVDDTIYLRFQQEARALANINHDKLVRIYDFGLNDKNEPYLVMELIEGESLSRVNKNRKDKLSIEAFLEIAIQITEAMIHAHNHGVIHRDLKSSNIIVCQDISGESRVKVIDFGLARINNLSSQDGNLTASHSIIGSPHCISPEQISGKRGDERADIYAVGSIMYEMLAGKYPFQTEPDRNLLLAKVESEAPPINQVTDRDIPEELESLVLRCLERNPEERYQSMEDLLKDLEKFQQSRGELNQVAEVVESLPEENKKSQKRHFQIAIISIILLGLIVMASIVVSAQKKSPNPATADVKLASIGLMEPGKSKERFSVTTQKIFYRSSGTSASVGGKVSSEELHSIKSKKLRRLEVFDRDMSDKDMELIAALPIRILELIEVKITPKGLKNLSRSKTLHRVDFREVDIDNEKIKLLKGLALNEVHLTGCNRVTGEGVIILNDTFPQLKRLHVPGTGIRGKDYSLFSRIKNLDYLNVEIRNEEEMKIISKMKELPGMRITNSKLTPNIISCLSGMKNLRNITFDRCGNVDHYQINFLKSMLPECKLHYKTTWVN